jgi:hypothetical protein
MTPQLSRFLEIFPVDKIAAVEIQGDDTVLPSPLLLRFLMEGRFADTSEPVNIEGSAEAPGRLWLEDRNCMQFNVLLDPAGKGIAGVTTAVGYLNARPACRTDASRLYRTLSPV